MKDFLKNYGGIIAGAVYALILRLVFNINDFEDGFSLFSFTFVWITPVIIGLIPLLYASNEQLDNWWFRISRPLWTVFVFFTLCYITRIEDLICLWIILIPYALGALTCGLIAGAIIKRVRKRRGTFYSVMLLPFLLCPIEEQLEKPVREYSVITRVTIDAAPETVWKNIVRVRQIGEQEYTKGFFNYAGIPRPLYAELDKDTLGATRTGYFEGGLKFIEKVSHWEKNRHIAFDITVVPASIRQTVFDQHVLMGGHFRFLNAAYTLQPLKNGQTELILTSSYQLSTHINAYGSYCGNQLLADFQERLLRVIRTRCEATDHSPHRSAPETAYVSKCLTPGSNSNRTPSSSG